MSKFECPVVTIKNVSKHPYADSLDIISFNEIGWIVIDRLGVRKTGEKVCYIPVDAMVPIKRREFSFLESNAMSTGYARIKTLKLRGVVSQGLIIDAPLKSNVGDDFNDYLEVVKYEPPPEALMDTQGGVPLPGWLTKADAERYQNAVNQVEPYRNDSDWVASVKYDGTSACVGVDYEEEEGKRRFIGSHRLMLTKETFYHHVAKSQDLLRKIELIGIELGAKQICLQGEICGPKIQKNRMGLPNMQFFAFDIFMVKDGFCDYLDYGLFLSLCTKYQIQTVPIIKSDKLPPLYEALDYANKLKYPNDYPAEGIVFVKVPATNIHGFGRAKVKIISQEYELKNKD
jgi:RNA ligase (TIGR02306 family)